MTIPGLLLAEDAVSLAESSQAQQDDLAKIEWWRERWKMSLNMTKCSVVVYGPGESVNCSVVATPVPTLQAYMYLVRTPMITDLDLLP